MSWRASLVAVVLSAAVCPAFVHAQNQGGGNGGGGGRQNGGGGGGGGRGGFDPAQMQQRRMDRLKETLNPSDDEWKVIEPKLTKVLDAQRDIMMSGGMMGGMFGGGGFGRRGGGAGGGGGGGGNQGGGGGAAGGPNGGGGGGGGGPGGGGPGGGGFQMPVSNTPLGHAQQDLKAAVDSDSSSPEDLDKKLTAYRDAKTKANGTLDGARKDLKEVLTAKQEAQLVLQGVLE